MNRRSIIVVLIGAIAGLAGFGSAALLRARRCAGLGAHWHQGARECLTAAGERVNVARPGDIAIGLFVALALAFMLFRVLLFVMGRMPRGSR